MRATEALDARWPSVLSPCDGQHADVADLLGHLGDLVACTVHHGVGAPPTSYATCLAPPGTRKYKGPVSLLDEEVSNGIPEQGVGAKPVQRAKLNGMVKGMKGSKRRRRK